MGAAKCGRNVPLWPWLDMAMLAALAIVACLYFTGCEQAPIQVQHKADVNHHIPDKIDINVRFPDRKPRNHRQR